MHRRFLLCAAIVSLGAVFAGCPIKDPPTAGKPCAHDDVCGSGSYCQLEIEPHVCIPGGLGIPPPPDHASFFERALVVATPGLTATGTFAARDVDGDAVSFAPTSGVVDTPLGGFTLDATGTYAFVARDDVKDGDTALVPIRAVSKDAHTDGNALVVVVVPAAPVELTWTGASTRFDDAHAWNPATTPTAATSVVVNGKGAATIANDVEVNGFVADGASHVTLDAVLSIRGTRYLNAAPFEKASTGSVSLTPVSSDAASFVRIAGELRAPTLSSSGAIASHVHSDGDLALVAGDVLVADRQNVVVDGSIDGGPAALRMNDAVLFASGNVTLAGANASSFTRATLYAGGDVSFGAKTTGSDVTLVEFGHVDANDDASLHALNVGDTSLVHFLDVHIAPGSGATFASDAAIGGVLTIAGGVAVEKGHTVDVDTLILRPAFQGFDHGGKIRAHQCFAAQRVTIPTSFISCDEAIAPPPEAPDAGPGNEIGTDAGPPTSCAFPPDTAGDPVTQGLVVAVAGSHPVVDTLQNDVDSFIPSTSHLRGGDLALAADGSFTFTPSSVPGDESTDVDVQASFGTLAGCAGVHVIDPSSKDELVGLSWDDAASWSGGALPGDNDDVLVPALDEAHTATPPSTTRADLHARALFVASGASLDLGGRTLHVATDVISGGSIANGTLALASGATFSGRLASVACEGNVAASSTASLAALSTTTGCTFDAGATHVSIDALNAGASDVSFTMTHPSTTLVIAGPLTTTGSLGGAWTTGSLEVHGDVVAHDWSESATLDHRLVVVQTGTDAHVGATTGGVQYDGMLIGELGGGTLTIDGGHVGELLADGNVHLNSALSVDVLFVTAAFDTDTPALWQVGNCVGGSSTICP